MWDKEVEVDKFWECAPLTNLLSQCKLSALDSLSPKPRDWIRTVKDAMTRGARGPEDGNAMKTELTSRSLRKRYGVKKLCRKWAAADAPALSVNANAILFNGSLEDITVARESSTAAAVALPLLNDGIVVPTILASDLILYLYQIYKLQLASADAANLLVGALKEKHLLYLTKIMSSLELRTITSCTSKAQIRKVTNLLKGSLVSLV